AGAPRTREECEEPPPAPDAPGVRGSTRAAKRREERECVASEDGDAGASADDHDGANDSGAPASDANGGEPHAPVKSPISHADDGARGDQNRRKAVEEAFAQLQELLKEPVNEDSRARWFAPEILCALTLLQD